MAKRNKREAAIRNNTKVVRYDDLDHVLRDAGFTLRDGSGSSHVTYSHPLLVPVVTVTVPHGDAKFVKPYQVKDALAKIDSVREKE